MRVTNEMVEAVWNHNKGTVFITKQMPFAQIDDAWRRDIREVLEAALAAAPVAGVDAPEPAGDAQPRPDRAEFEALLDAWYLAHRAQHVGGMAALNGEIPKDCEIQDPSDLMVHLLMEDRAARRAVLHAAGYQEGE